MAALPPESKLYIGIDNGTTGAVAALYPTDQAVCHPVMVMRLGNEKLLDVQGNIEVLRTLIGASQSVLVAFEQAQIAPKFGAKNNYTNGKNNEFWRVLLTLERIPFCWVNPKTWQKTIFHGIRGTDTKVMAELVRRQRFPDLDLREYNASQREGINDALGIALWARQIRL
jgi:hypothetical protein